MKAKELAEQLFFYTWFYCFNLLYLSHLNERNNEHHKS